MYVGTSRREQKVISAEKKEVRLIRSADVISNTKIALDEREGRP